MTTTSITDSFDIAGFSRATEERDAIRLAALYADDATVEVVDPDHQPRSPRRMRGRPEITSWLEDTYSRDMTHQVVDPIAGVDRIALTIECAYPDGTNVLCAFSADVRDGLITRQRVIQVWDDS